MAAAQAQRVESFAALEDAPPDLADDLPDLSAFKTAPKGTRPKVDKAATRAAAESAGFTSREPATRAGASAPAQPDHAPRGRRQRRAPTRREQFNLRADAGTIERFIALADKQGWLLAETFEEAVAALEAKLGKS